MQSKIDPGDLMKTDLKMWHLNLMAWVTFGYAVIFWYFTDQMGRGGMFDYLIFGYDQVVYRNNMYLLGDLGADIYKFQALPLDLVYPCMYGITALIAWEMLVKPTNPKLYWIGSLVMVAAILFDYGENVRLGFLLFEIGKPSVEFVNITSNFTLTKWLLLTIFIFMLATMSVKRLVEARRQKTNG